MNFRLPIFCPISLMAVGQLEWSAFVLFRILFYRFSLGCSIRFTCLSSPRDERFGVILQSLFQFRLFGKLRDELVKEWGPRFHLLSCAKSRLSNYGVSENVRKSKNSWKATRGLENRSTYGRRNLVEGSVAASFLASSDSCTDTSAQHQLVKAAAH